MVGSRLHLIDGNTLDVDQLPEDAARMLWSTPSEAAGRGAYDAHEMRLSRSS